MLIFYLALAVLAVPLGAGIAFTSRAQQKHFSIIFGFTAGAVLGIVLMLMLHLYTEYGYATILIMWGGFLLISVLEYMTPWLGIEKRGASGGAARFDKRHFWGVNIALIGLSIHSLTDGFNLVIAAKEGTWGGPLALAILVHRLPIAILISVALLRDSASVSRGAQLIPLMFGPLLGALLGEQLLRGPFKELTEYLTAFAAGTLLHIVVDGFRGSYLPQSGGLSKVAKVMFIIGFILTFCVIRFFPGFEPIHYH